MSVWNLYIYICIYIIGILPKIRHLIMETAPKSIEIWSPGVGRRCPHLTIVFWSIFPAPKTDEFLSSYHWHGMDQSHSVRHSIMMFLSHPQHLRFPSHARNPHVFTYIYPPYGFCLEGLLGPRFWPWGSKKQSIFTELHQCLVGRRWVKWVNKRMACTQKEKTFKGIPQNGWFKRDNPIKMDDLGIPTFMETPT